MLRKRSRPALKDQSKGQMVTDNQNHVESCFSSDQKPRKSSSFFSVPGLFVGFSSKVAPDCDSAKSPTSPLEYNKLFSSLSNTFARSPRSSPVHPKSWDCGKVGLGLVDSFNNDSNNPSGNLSGSTENKNLLLLGINIPSPKAQFVHLKTDFPSGEAPMSLPKDYGVSSLNQLGLGKSSEFHCDLSKEDKFQAVDFGKLRSYSADGSIFQSSVPLPRLHHEKPKSSSEVFHSDPVNTQLGSPEFGKRSLMEIDKFSGSLPVYINSSQGLIGSLSASDIELSEDYTCIVCHGPNPKTTHIFGDCILESHSIQSPNFKNKLAEESLGSSWVVKCSEALPSHGPSDDFLSYCFSCKKKLEGKDIHMYRGEKAFCSYNCREQEILMEEEMENPLTEHSISPGSSFHEEIFLDEMVISA